MRIAIDIRALGQKRTGDEVYIHKIIEYLKINKQDFKYYLFTNNDNWYELNLLKDLPEYMEVVVIKPKNKFLWTMYALPKACTKYKIDLLHVMYITPMNLPEHTKLITTIHDISWKFVGEHINWKDKLFLDLLIPISIKRADLVLTVSKYAKHSIHIIYNTPKGKIKYIYNGGFIKNIPATLKLSPKINHIVAKNYVLYLGSLQPRKNIPNMIKGFYLYKQKNPKSNLKFVIAGGKGHNYDQNIDDIIQKYQLEKEVLFAGFVSEDEKIALMRNARIFLFVSLYEGFGIPPIESMSLKTPIIVANTSCLPEISGKGGISVDPYNEQELCDAMHKILSSDIVYKDLVEKGLEQATKFQWDECIKEIVKTYKDILFK